MNVTLTKRAATSIVLIIVLAASFSGALVYVLSQEAPPKTQTLTIAVPPLEQNALLYVAESQGYFASNGLSVVVKNYDTGVIAINAVLNGNADIAEAAEFPFVSSIMKNNSLSIIACNDQFQNENLIALRTHRIEAISDLKGKTVGVARGTIAEFYLGRFLELNGMSLQDVNIVNVPPAEYVASVANGSLDALVAWQPYVNQIQNQVSGAIFSWDVQCSQPAYGVLTAEKSWLNNHADAVQRFLRALGSAQDFVVNNMEAARSIVQTQLNYTQAYTEAVWPMHNFAVTLPQSLMVALNDEAQWMINSGTANQTSNPNFLDYIYFDGLVSVKPQSVSIAR